MYSRFEARGRSIARRGTTAGARWFCGTSPERSLVVVPAAAAFDALRLAHGNLDMVDVVAVEQWFKDRIAEPEQQQVLRRLFAEVVIDAVNLVFTAQPVQRFTRA